MNRIILFYLGIFCLFLTTNIFSQTTIQGKILDEQGKSLPGANVVISGTTLGTVSDQDGEFSLRASFPTPFEIEVSFIGFETKKLTVNTPQLGVIVLSVENSFDEVIVSALVFKPFTNHNFRLSFNQAANPLPASNLYFDLPIQSIPNVFDVWITGAINPYTFGSSPQIDWLIPGVPNTPVSVGFPLAAAYAAVTGPVLEGLTDAAAQDPALAQILPIISSVLQNPASTPAGFSPAITTDLNEKPLAAEDGNNNLISTLRAYEFGYKGVFNKRLSLGFDVYYFELKGNAGFQQISPVATITGLEDALGQGVQTTTQPQIETALIGIGMDATTAAATANALGQLINETYASAGGEFIRSLEEAGLPFHGIIPTEQAPEGDSAKLIYGYITQDPNRISSNWGFEFSSKYFMTEHLSSFVNYTWFSRSDEEPGDLNFPQNKIRARVSYQSEKKLSSSLSYQWDQDYTSNVATFPGKIDAKSIFDLTLGYKINQTLLFELAATNLFENKFRALPGLPMIGRTISGRLLFNFK